MTMQALVWTGNHNVTVRDQPQPIPADGWVLVDVAYCGLCGTDLHICAGEHPRSKPGLVIGHEISGTVHADRAGFAAGTKVVVDPLLPCGACPPCRNRRPHTCASLRLIGIDVPGGAARQVAVPADRLIPAPDTADLRQLAFAEPLAVAVRAVRRSGLRLGEQVVVAGAGPVGLAVATCARLAGAATVVVAEPLPVRRKLAANLGFEIVETFAGLSADVFFDAAGHPSVAAGMTAVAAPTSRIILVGVYGMPTTVDLQAATFKELTIIGSRVYSRDDIRTATEMIATGRFDAEPFLTRTVPLDGAASAIDELRAGREVKVLVEGAA
ncbi:zinc-dependent alcohol dehydrogenase [Streptomyces cucumeris]|uniref:zinc-dependent alcohol dehydrogenase n=1 Tax=Streptomyces cucumeris TaxID=2962890 RepID=UPI0020C8F04A|nr:alcohol dehydrogenase catalytic domain-containing protein [Streptomyces sp. NEAU-Y11]MCP9213522.1 alcohol dehydrogenase catalytic domain-containing protein [Streptomyces sp. NEAU-Y11]